MEFTSRDFVVAFQHGAYEQGPRKQVKAVPEPAGWLLIGLGLSIWGVCSRARSCPGGRIPRDGTAPAGATPRRAPAARPRVCSPVISPSLDSNALSQLLRGVMTILSCATMLACSHAAADAASFWGIGEVRFINDDTPRLSQLRVSADGSTVAVTAAPDSPPWHTQEMSFLWTVETGLVGLGLNDHGLSVYARDVSGDGSLIVGRGYVPGPQHPSNPFAEAMYWTDSTGWTSFGFAANFPGSIGANGISDDGSTVIGAANPDTGDQYQYRWSEATGMVPITDSLHYQEVDLNDVSADGSVIVGECLDRDGVFRLASEVCRWNEEGEATGLGHLKEGHDISSGNRRQRRRSDDRRD